MTQYLNSLGIMTGNSLDGVDAVLTRFGTDGSIEDLLSYALPMPQELSEALRMLRVKVNDNKGTMELVASSLSESDLPESFRSALRDTTSESAFNLIEQAYTEFVAQAVDQIKMKLSSLPDQTYTIDLIGSHGQTCAHLPPSVAKSKNKDLVYTVQIGNGQRLADLTGIPVVCDFRSDDIMNGGEGAPLAPVHHQHLARVLHSQGYFPIAFCNAGNTGNITIITEDKQSKKLSVSGWDTGPFNHYPDLLARTERQSSCDRDGNFGKEGTVSLALLKLLFDGAVCTTSGENFLHSAPPKSSDPQWYRLPDELTGTAAVEGSILSFSDRIRTAEYFSAYIYFYTLSHISQNHFLPRHFALCGGGWKNPLTTEHFKALVENNETISPLLQEHKELFRQLHRRIHTEFAPSSAIPVSVKSSLEFGFDGTVMEARIFADAAVCRVRGEPFTRPETSGAEKPTVAGIIRFPNRDQKAASPALRATLEEYNSLGLTIDLPEKFDPRWSRASAGWAKRIHEH